MSNTTVTPGQRSPQPLPRTNTGRRYELATDIGRQASNAPRLPADYEAFMAETNRISDEFDRTLNAVRARTAEEFRALLGERGVHGAGDPTPVDDLEEWQHSYDPAAAAVLDAQLDEAFGPLPGARRDDIEWRTAR